jgi:hypothetical protein
MVHGPAGPASPQPGGSGVGWAVAAGAAGVLVFLAAVLVPTLWASGAFSAHHLRASPVLLSAGPASQPTAVAVATTPSTAATPSAAPSDQPGMPNAMVGRWTGTYTYAGSGLSDPVTLTLTGGPVGTVVGTSFYSQGNCAGQLTLERGGAAVEVFEHIVSGSTCFSASLSLSLDSTGHLVYSFGGTTYGSARGVLTRQP